MFSGPLHAATLQIYLKVFSPTPDVFATCFNLDVTKCLAIAESAAQLLICLAQNQIYMFICVPELGCDPTSSYPE